MNKKTLAWIASAIFSLATGISQVSAQDMYRPPAVFNQEDLDQLLAPVALYPDSLLAQVLMAATYPLEVVQAARFIESRPGLPGDALARAVAPMPWDPSVKSLVQFPSVLTMMNDKLDWMQRLGEAFLSQQANVMDTVQNLRMRAQVAGNLYSNSQQRVVQQEQIIVIEPINPQIIYVPYYNPVVVYGNWWWPQRPPVYWTPPPRYRPPSYNPAISQGIAFSVGIGVSQGLYNNARPDWHQHQVLINNVRINNSQVNNRITINQQPQIWQHNRANQPYLQNRRPPEPAPAANGIRLNPAPVGITPPQAAMPVMAPARPEPEHRPQPAVAAPARPAPAAPQAAAPARPAAPATPRPERMERPAPMERPERQERPAHVERAPQQVQRPQAEARPAPQAASAPRPEPQREQHREAPHPAAKPKTDDHPHRPDDK